LHPGRKFAVFIAGIDNLIFVIIESTDSLSKKEKKMEGLSIITWIIVGAIAGLLADWVVKSINMGLIGKIIVGILGGFLGGWLLGLLGIHFGSSFISSVLTAFIGAVILLLLLALLRRKK
jgi:uncharacterized membrane protein YeaQ/YmgE (transglycosylase-associated protein family)